MENMREYWAREAEMMRDKSAVLASKEQVLARPNYEIKDDSEFPVIGERANVLMVQVTKNGQADEPLQSQYNKLKNDLYNNKEWDVMYCQNVGDAAEKLSKRTEIENLVYLHHGSDWGYMPIMPLRENIAKSLIEKRNKFLTEDNKKGEKLGKKFLNSDNYKDNFVKSHISDVKDAADRSFINAFFGVENLLKNVQSDGTFVDASCFQGNEYNSKEHTVFDSLRLLSFEDINIYVNTNATGVETSKTFSISRIGDANSTFLVTVGTIMNHGLTSGFQHKEGWIYFASSTKGITVTKEDLMLNSYKKPLIQRVSYEYIGIETNRNRQLWFSKTFRDLKREDVKRWMYKGNTKQKLDEKLVEEWFKFYTKGIEKDAKL